MGGRLASWMQRGVLQYSKDPAMQARMATCLHDRDGQECDDAWSEAGESTGQCNGRANPDEQVVKCDPPSIAEKHVAVYGRLVVGSPARQEEIGF